MSGHIFARSTIDLLNQVYIFAGNNDDIGDEIAGLIDVNREVRGHTDEEIETIRGWLEGLDVPDAGVALTVMVADMDGYALGEEVEAALSEEDAADWDKVTTKALPITVYDKEARDGVLELIGKDPIHSESLLSVVEANAEEPNAGWGVLNNVLEDPRVGKHDWIILKDS